MSNFILSQKHDRNMISRTPEIYPNLFLSIQEKNNMGNGPPRQATASDARFVQTDIDEIPYRRFFRGNFQSENPIVMDREAGFRQIVPSSFPVQASPYIPSVTQGLYCFQPPCSTIFPCNPSLGPSLPQSCVFISP